MGDSAENGSQRTAAFGAYLRGLRSALRLSLRDVEEATNKEISNAYLSQLETGKIAKPSPNILYALAELYGASYQAIMQRAGYIAPIATRVKPGAKHGRVPTFAVEHLSAEEEAELLKYLAFIRSQRGPS
jgi:HTH-type transcriptional regulator, competence development regulator